MPVFNPIMDNKVLGREIRRGIEIGELNVCAVQFPDWADKKISG
jgi:hypothetical protein